MPSPESWPLQRTAQTLLAKAVVSPAEFYGRFREWKSQAKYYGNGVHPIPVVLDRGETLAEYDAEF